MRKLATKGGVIDSRVVTAAEIKRLAELPPRQVLLAQLVGGIASPLTGMMTVLSGVTRGLVVALDQIRQQREAA
jgi:large subunit ribosomal protein L10